MRSGKGSGRTNLLEEWEEALDMEALSLGDEAEALLHEFSSLVSGGGASILTRMLNLPLELLDALAERGRG